ncbi:hypothetical protein [Cryptosporangium sp. NPDC048952]|uniref:hypothetical protein n=1 Tax=Cryptosporangium sp. NPDC048952 TaxID=3363961 RepID=UPI003724BCAC
MMHGLSASPAEADRETRDLSVMPPRWHRTLTREDVETARGVLPMHHPTGLDPLRPVCASATHLIVVQSWPCEQHRWARWVLDADDRGEIT